MRVLVAVGALERGQALTEEALTVRDIPQAYVEDRSIRASDKSKILGLRLSGPVEPQQTLLWTDLGGSEEHPELSSLVQPGRRALTLQFRDSGAMLRPGDYVDVIAAVPEGIAQGDGNASRGDAHAARVLLQNVLLLAVGDSVSVEASNDMSARPGLGRLTLSVTLAEAQLLILASERGMLSTVLRGREDNHVAQRAPDVTVATMFDAAARESLGMRRTSATELPTLPGNVP